MKRKILLALTVIMLTLLVPLALTGCGGKENPPNGPEEYTVRLEANGSTETVKTVDGMVAEPDAPTKTGYTFLGWYKGDKLWNFGYTVTEDMTLAAKWQAKTYTVTFDVQGGEEISALTVTYDEEYILPTPVRSGYSFGGWFGEVDMWESGVWTTDGDVTLVAAWELISSEPCTEHADGDGDGLCDSCGEVVESDEPCAEHADGDGDGLCDSCGEVVESDEPCTEHADGDGDGLCDSCGEVVESAPVIPGAPSSEEISTALGGGNINSSYSSEEGSYPFVTVDTDGDGTMDAVMASNAGFDGTRAVLIATVRLTSGQAVVFDYLCSSDESDSLSVTVNGRGVLDVGGVYDSWQTSYAYVASMNEVCTVTFVYEKDGAVSNGEDTAYIKNLRTVSSDELTEELYVLRYAALTPNDAGDGYLRYNQVVLNTSDGYYHVGNADGPILLCNLLDTTLFDTEMSLADRLALDNGMDAYPRLGLYLGYAEDSKILGAVPVTEELRGYLEAYAESYREQLGRAEHNSLWLQLCCYYNAYGTNGAQMSDPIKGLASFSANTVSLDGPVSISYVKALSNGGYLYSFIPDTDGAYRIVGVTDSPAVVYVYTGGHYVSEGRADLYADSLLDKRGAAATEEELTVYLTAGETYYLSAEFADGQTLGNIILTVSLIDGRTEVLTESSSADGRIKIDYLLCNADECEECRSVAALTGAAADSKYYHYVDSDGELGSVIYADFSGVTDLVPDATLIELAEDGTLVVDGNDISSALLPYITSMIDSTEHPELAGCVPVDGLLAEQLRLAALSFNEALGEDGWLAFCYNYRFIGDKELLKLEDMLASTSFGSAVITVSTETTLADTTMDGSFFATCGESDISVEYSYEQFAQISPDSSDVFTTVEGSAVLDREGNLTEGSLGEIIISLLLLDVELDPMLVDYSMADGGLVGTVSSSNTEAVFGVLLSDVTLEIATNGERITELTLVYSDDVGINTVTAVYS